MVQLCHRPFDGEQLHVLLSPATATELLFQNDIYAKVGWLCMCRASL